jgi:excisionase family DNA binding protein
MMIMKTKQEFSTTEASEYADVTIRYIRAEIEAGRLVARRVGKVWIINRDDLEAWMKNPKRGSRSKKRD